MFWSGEPLCRLHKLSQLTRQHQIKLHYPALLQPHLAEVTPRLAEVTPRLAEVTPRLAEVTPRMAEVTPRLAEVTPRLTEVTPRLTEVTTDVAGVTTDVAGVTTDVAGVTTDVQAGVTTAGVEAVSSHDAVVGELTSRSLWSQARVAAELGSADADDDDDITIAQVSNSYTDHVFTSVHCCQPVRRCDNCCVLVTAGGGGTGAIVRSTSVATGASAQRVLARR